MLSLSLSLSCFYLFVGVVVLLCLLWLLLFRFRLLLFFVFLMALFYSCLSAQNFKITCPASGFKAGEPATVTCQVNKTALYDPCVLFPTFVQFYFTSSSGVKSRWCMSPYSTCGTTSWPLPACGKCSCACEKSNENFTSHRLDFVPTSAHTAGNFSCEVNCLHFKPLPPLTKNKCDRVTVGKLTVTHSSFITS